MPPAQNAPQEPVARPVPEQQRPESPKSACKVLPSQMDQIRGLQRQLKERDRQIEELTFQLKALKQIDEESRQGYAPARLPAFTTQD